MDKVVGITSFDKEVLLQILDCIITALDKVAQPGEF